MNRSAVARSSHGGETGHQDGGARREFHPFFFFEREEAGFWNRPLIYVSNAAFLVPCCNLP
jgi:hypothetical protein